jgi:hypothetical protein
LGEGWKELAAAASVEKDPVKLRLIIDKLIATFGEEQKRVRKEIQQRIQGLDPLTL